MSGEPEGSRAGQTGPMTPCPSCTEIRDAGRVLVPLHVVHPETGKARVYDVRGLAICRECGGVWHARRDNTFALLGCVRLRAA